jgi:D-alanine-D-alanine ligase
MFVKPANLGSSVGISKAKTRASLVEAVDLARSFDRRIVVEAAVPQAREIECGVLGNDEPEASVPGEVIPSREFYDYEAKYLDDGSKTVIPADLPADTAATIRQLSIAAFKAVDCAGMARVDFLLCRRDGRIFVNEVNTIPGFTTISMYSKMWSASGVSYPELLERLIALALERHAARQQLRTSAT